MRLWLVLTIIFVPPFLTFLFYIILAIRNRPSKRYEKERFVVHLPASYSTGCSIFFFGVPACLLCFFSPLPDPVYGEDLFLILSAGIFIWFGVFGNVFAIRHRIVVNRDKITFYPLLSKSYTVPFDELTSVQCCIRGSFLGSYIRGKQLIDFIEIRTNKRLFTVLKNYTECDRLMQKILKDVDSSKIHGDVGTFL